MTTLDDVLALVAVDSVSTNEHALATHVHDRLIANSDLDVERVGDNVIARTCWSSRDAGSRRRAPRYSPGQC